MRDFNVRRHIGTTTEPRRHRLSAKWAEVALPKGRKKPVRPQKRDRQDGQTLRGERTIPVEE